MTYPDALDYLFNKTLVFQHIGAQAYKPGLETAEQLSRQFGHPEKAFKSIHIAGTNGKGSTSHLLAAILQEAGYKVGLFTSPHLLDFRERIKVDGQPVSETFVSDFVKAFTESGYAGRQPSFFELTTIMAFKYFAEQKVDFAVIETGLGGRLDSTNIITPILSIITNISFDHTQFLGDTLAAIAGEKSGIIKHAVPIVIGEYTEETKSVFSGKAAEEEAPIVFAQDSSEIVSFKRRDNRLSINTRNYGQIDGELSGDCQIRNADTVLHALDFLESAAPRISTESIKRGFYSVCRTTGLLGRWMKVGDRPLTICDTAHNPGGFRYIAEQLKRETCRTLRIVIGFVSDKDIAHVLEMLPENAVYYFTRPSTPRALPAATLADKAKEFGLTGSLYETVEAAYRQASVDAHPDDMIYIGGSTFVVADFLKASATAG